MNAFGYGSPEYEAYRLLGAELMQRAMAETDSLEEISAWAMAQLQLLAGTGNENARLTWEDSFTLYEQIMAKRMAEAETPEEERKLLTWPWASWSSYLDPAEPGMLIEIAAADGMGKTLYAENIAEHWAQQGRRVVFLHFELNRAIMMDRRMVRHAGIPRRTLRLGKLSAAEEVERQRATEYLRSWRGGITYLHTPGWTIERALAEVAALIGEELCDVFVIDYLEKAAASPRQLKLFSTNIYAREANDVELIKSFSEQQEVPAVLLAQLNKVGKGTSFPLLDRTAIRGAGEKTEKANVVILLHRENPETQLVQVRIDKNTIGRTGSFDQWMEADRFRVCDIERARPEPEREEAPW